ncbi:MAG: single-stranded-DNA-specific exonuclease RecJ [Brevefilum sp.]|jgi:single-stranded-DNA-specific exonuclease
MMVEKRWVQLEKINLPPDFADAIGGNPLVAETLFRRGYQTLPEAKAFLDPLAYQPGPPEALPDFEIACQLLQDAIHHQKRILIWGDFDVDGQTATTTLFEGLQELGGKVSYHIPVRGRESHGITRPVLEGYLQEGFDLFLTCDTGITEHENIAHIRNQGIPVIVTDHHSLGESLPPANAIVNPQRLPADHPLRTLPGVGVTYKLMEGLFAMMGQTINASHYMELTALGIVADVAELKNDTRFLLQMGLESLRRTQRVGLQTLYQYAGLNPLHLTEDHIGYQIAPRMNAIGRLGDANVMVEFLTTDDPGQARILATQIEAVNTKRRFTTRQVEKAAESQLQNSLDERHAPAIVLHHPDWPGGVVGIVASRLVERYHKPAILLTGVDPVYGSARSVEGINITKTIASQSDLLNRFGGHPMAAGLSLPASHLLAFKKGFTHAVKEQASEFVPFPEIEVNATLQVDEINMEFVTEINRLAPFGPGNPPLNFLVEDVVTRSSKRVGSEGEHRQVTVEDQNGNRFKLIWWNGGEEMTPDAPFDLVCTLSQSDYQGSLQVSAVWVDGRLSEKGQEMVARRQIEIEDLRDVEKPFLELKNLLNQHPDALVWAEGDTSNLPGGKGRHDLNQADTLILWTIPPSQDVLHDVLQKVTPENVAVFAVDPVPDTVVGIKIRLAGLVKYAVNHEGGTASIEKLASACAADPETIRIGLKYWQAMGKIQIRFEDENVVVRLEDGEADPLSIEIYDSILKALVAESRAYRHYFKTGALNQYLTEKVVARG